MTPTRVTTESLSRRPDNVEDCYAPSWRGQLQGVDAVLSALALAAQSVSPRRLDPLVGQEPAAPARAQGALAAPTAGLRFFPFAGRVPTAPARALGALVGVAAKKDIPRPTRLPHENREGGGTESEPSLGATPQSPSPGREQGGRRDRSRSEERAERRARRSQRADCMELSLIASAVKCSWLARKRNPNTEPQKAARTAAVRVRRNSLVRKGRA